MNEHIIHLYNKIKTLNWDTKLQNTSASKTVKRLADQKRVIININRIARARLEEIKAEVAREIA